MSLPTPFEVGDGFKRLTVIALFFALAEDEGVEVTAPDFRAGATFELILDRGGDISAYNKKLTTTVNIQSRAIRSLDDSGRRIDIVILVVLVLFVILVVLVFVLVVLNVLRPVLLSPDPINLTT